MINDKIDIKLKILKDEYEKLRKEYNYIVSLKDIIKNINGKILNIKKFAPERKIELEELINTKNTLLKKYKTKEDILKKVKIILDKKISIENQYIYDKPYIKELK